MNTENIAKQDNIYVRVLLPDKLDDNLDLIWMHTKTEAIQTAREVINSEKEKGCVVVCEINDYMKRFKPLLIV